MEELISKRLTSLQQVEQIVAEARTLNAEGRLEQDRYRKQLALQGDLLLQRVHAARELYRKLKEVAQAEKNLRQQ